MKVALFPSVARVQVVIARPTSSNPVLQVYVAVSPTELPADVTSPLLTLLALAQSAEKRVSDFYSKVPFIVMKLTKTDRLCWRERGTVSICGLCTSDHRLTNEFKPSVASVCGSVSNRITS